MPKPKSSLIFTLLACLTASAAAVYHRMTPETKQLAQSQFLNDDQLDSRLRQAAISALQQREGTIIVIDPRNGRLRTVLNSEMAFGKSFAPGSTIKPFAALAAMRLELTNSPTLCREKYSHREFHTVCSHSLRLPPLNTADALAYSCNFYFAKLGERLNEMQFRALLSEFGFGQRSGINAPSESYGRLGGEWRPQNALGEGDYLQVTPIQLLLAYSALVNDGQLFRPQIVSGNNFSAQMRKNLSITQSEREVVLDGLRGAVRLGTARNARFDSFPLYILGKTGTSMPLKGFRPQGWFVGFAAESESQLANSRLGVLVFLKRGHGSDAAEVSRQIFAEYVSAEAVSRARASSPSLRLAVPVSSSRRVSASAPTVRVHLQRQNATKTLSLEEYLRGVVATEGSTETRVEALKALAVTSRTYALRNLRRHGTDGFDFCDITHCQRFIPVNNVRGAVLEAIDATEGEVLKDSVGKLAESYFSASCGGETADIATLWGGRGVRHLKGVNDEYCGTMPHSRWTDVISAKDLSRALLTDVRADIGGGLRDILVSRRDHTGRAEQVTLVGTRNRTISGWTFKIIVGRALGWNNLKSSRFHILRSGENFVFRGSGFGHGLGLCQEGAHIMAERGFGYRQILEKYFPGTNVGPRSTEGYSADLLWSASSCSPSHLSDPTLGVLSGLCVSVVSVLENNTITEALRTRRLHKEDPPTSTQIVARQAVKGRGRISSEHFRLSYPRSIGQKDAEYLLQLMEEARRALLSRPSLPAAARLPFLEVFVNESTGDFVARTGLPSWAAAGSQGDRIELQPLGLLKRRGIVETTLRHELVHKIIDSLGKGQAPRWLSEGLAVYLAGEGRLVSRFQPKARMTITELEKNLAANYDARKMRELYAAAYAEVRNLISLEGEAAVWQRMLRVQND